MIERIEKYIYIYRPDQKPEILDHSEVVSGNPELPGFVLRMTKIW
ncbi:hypothetical protein VB735_05375 [Halotia wernerae UHCC 0503]|nr:hypothetical protein [Halotia wernerae UHCC 0503]